MSNAISSGVLTANTLLWTGRHLLAGVIAGADGTNEATINIYDGTSTAGSKILSLTVPVGQRQCMALPCKSIQLTTGLYVEVSGTGASAQVFYGA